MRPPSSTLRYLDGVSSTGLQLAVVGKDPFPSNATGIAFCKPAWDQQLAENCSGRHVLLSLGFDPSATQAEYATPSLLFERLRTVGIVFLNASYIYVGTPIRKAKHLAHLQHAYQVNKVILEAAKAVLYCGEASKMRWVAPINREGSYACRDYAPQLGASVSAANYGNPNRRVTPDSAERQVLSPSDIPRIMVPSQKCSKPARILASRVFWPVPRGVRRPAGLTQSSAGASPAVVRMQAGRPRDSLAERPVAGTGAKARCPQTAGFASNVSARPCATTVLRRIAPSP